LKRHGKYFILCVSASRRRCSGTILLYFAAEKLLGVEAAHCCGPN